MIRPPAKSIWKKIYQIPISVVKNMVVSVRDGFQEVVDEHREHLPYPPGYPIPVEKTWKEWRSGVYRYWTYAFPYGVGCYIVNWKSPYFVSPKEFELRWKNRKDPNYMAPWDVLSPEGQEYRRLNGGPVPEEEIQETPQSETTERVLPNVNINQDAVSSFLKTRYDLSREMFHQFTVGYRESLGREIKLRSESDMSNIIDQQDWMEKIRGFAEKSKKWKDELSSTLKITDEEMKK